MKIKEFETFVVGNPPPHLGGRYFIFVKLTTDSGVSGVGEAYAANFGPHAVARMIEDICARHVVGADPFRIEHLWRRIYGAGYTQRPDTSVMGAVSAIEMACWDIIGKELGRPVYDLLGGKVHEKLRSYTYLYPREGEGWDFYDDPYRSAEAAAQCVAQGFTAVKFDPAGPYSIYDGRQFDLPSLDRSALFCKLIREAVGDKADLLFGTHGQGTAAGAIRLAKRIEPYDPLWLEEPTPPERPEEMARVARQTSIPIATGERLTTKWEFARVVELQAAAILQMNLGRCGGVLEAKKIAALAETRYVQIAPHLYCGPVVGAANVQIAACSPNFLILESIQTWGGFHAEILKTPMTWQDGYVIPPEAPGLGVELNEEVARAHPYEGDELHLDMKPYPLSTYDDGNS
jgi:2-dehydro-3-deoxyphosphogalactonate aldolase